MFHQAPIRIGYQNGGGGFRLCPCLGEVGREPVEWAGPLRPMGVSPNAGEEAKVTLEVKAGRLKDANNSISG
jgi:hypothetical protein